MATFLDIGVMQHFTSVFVILLVFVIVFGLLETVKAFGSDKKGLHALIALMVAFIIIVSKMATNMITTMVPWMIVLVIFIFFVMFMLRMWGLGDSDLKSLIGNSEVYPWLIVLIVIVLLTSLSTVFGQSLLEKGGTKGDINVDYNASLNGQGSGSTIVITDPKSTATSDFMTNFLNTIRNPKMLGMVFVLIVGAFTLLFLTKSYNPN
jgi:hypothetical protein